MDNRPENIEQTTPRKPGRRRNPYYTGPQSDHFDGVRFFNPGKPQPEGLLRFLKWQVRAKWAQWPETFAQVTPDRPPQSVPGTALRASFVGHATVLLQTAGLNILTDPVWAERASPSQRFGPKRAQPPGIAFDDLPRIDAVLVTHNHYDHLDTQTVARLWQRDRPRIITPLGNDTIIRRAAPGMSVVARDWFETVDLDGGVRVHLDPTHHWSARGVRDRRMALWASFAIETPGGVIYFVGDSGYGGGDYFRDARERYGPFRFAVLPIGAYEPRWFMSYSHMNPEEAVMAHRDLGEPPTLASHFATFRLTGEAWDAPVSALDAARIEFGISPERFRALDPGAVWTLD